LSYDDNGTLWGLDNGGNILEIGTLTAEATNVATLAVNEVTGAGADSLAISIVDPGTYVVLTDGADNHDTTYLADNTPPDPDPAPIDPEDDGWALNYDPTGTNVTIDTNGAGTVTVTQNGGTSVENVYVQSDNQADITISNFDDVEVQTRGEGPSTITVNDAITGMVDTGEGDDIINLDLTNISSFTINGDGGFDTVAIDGALVLGDGTLSLGDIEALDITGTGDSDLTITYEDVLGATDEGDILHIYGNDGDVVNLLDLDDIGTGEWVPGEDNGVGTEYHYQVGGAIEATVIIDNAIAEVHIDNIP